MFEERQLPWKAMGPPETAAASGECPLTGRESIDSATRERTADLATAPSAGAESAVP
jgi:hypothetical protein